MQSEICGEVQTVVTNPLTLPAYDKCRHWIRERMVAGDSVESIRNGGQSTPEGFAGFLAAMKQYDRWPEDLDREKWLALVSALDEERQRQIRIETMSVGAQSVEPSAIHTVEIPRDRHSAWQVYRAHLLEDADFSPAAVQNVEDACTRTLRVLSTETAPENPRRGLIVGNVQSGKTANIAGLMAMSADMGFNIFVILSGTIESLRLQTQERLFGDLNAPNRRSSLFWQSFDHPAKGGPPGERAQDLLLSDDSLTRYMTVCLKNTSRLDQLIAWLWEDRLKMRQMRILVIDDEADQASIDTSKAHAEERSAVNRLILNLVYGPQRVGKQGAYGAMNYISYTATPYANCLNEAGPGTLYPHDFIQTLAAPQSYFGPDKMFPTPYSALDGTLDNCRTISAQDAKIMRDIQRGEVSDIPGSLQQALMWFFCVCGIMRYHDYRKPVSFLLHTSQNVDHHDAVAQALLRWIPENRPHLIDWCRDLYAVERLRVTKHTLRQSYPDYEHSDAEIWDFPDFEDIVPFIEEVISDVASIWLDDSGDLQYGRSVHLCVDNCRQNGVDEAGVHMRLAYPKTDLGFAPAFIVIGGNTLSRGLTLQGLVVSYFLRSVSQADTLMQMARWFGYRPHYELFPRVWMTQDTFSKFTLLATIDYDLRLQIYRMQQTGQTPSEFALKIITSPMIRWLRLTSPVKMKNAEIASVDFAGTQTQLTVYDKAEDILLGNLHCTERFLESLGTPRKSDLTAAFCWDRIPYRLIHKNLFGGGFRIAATSKVFQQLEFLNDWIEEQTKQGRMDLWTVLACGLEFDEAVSSPERMWRLPGDHRLQTVTRTARSETDTTFNIGVLADRRDFLADIRPDMVTPDDWKLMKKTSPGQLDHDYFRQQAGVGDTPLLLLYRIFRQSKARPGSSRQNLDLKADAIGLTMVCPGTRDERSDQQRVQIRSSLLDVVWEVEADAD